MLKHEDNPQLRTQPAASVRVTPEELAAAITALQIRKEGQPGTIAIGDAVEELGLDVTPEEVLAEVQARRTSKKQPPKTRLKALSAALAALVGLSIWGISQQFTGSPSVDVQTMPTISYVPIQGPQSQHIKANPNLLVKDNSNKVVLLSEVKDNQPVECYYDYSAGSFVPFTSQNAGFPFTLIKHSGQVYVRGGMPRMSEQALQKNGADVTWDTESGVPVTLPLNGFQVVPGTGNGASGFHAVNIHLDKHTYEKW